MSRTGTPPARRCGRGCRAIARWPLWQCSIPYRSWPSRSAVYYGPLTSPGAAAESWAEKGQNFCPHRRPSPSSRTGLLTMADLAQPPQPHASFPLSRRAAARHPRARRRDEGSDVQVPGNNGARRRRRRCTWPLGIPGIGKSLPRHDCRSETTPCRLRDRLTGRRDSSVLTVHSLDAIFVG